jgi:hypothetical protein
MQMGFDDAIHVTIERLGDVCGMRREKVDVDSQLAQIFPQARVDSTRVAIEDKEDAEPPHLELWTHGCGVRGRGRRGGRRRG